MRYFLIVFLFSATTSIAQTSIMPIIGIDALRLSKLNDGPLYDIQDNIQNGFVINKPFIGIKLEQSIRKQLMLYYQISYTKKNYDNTYAQPGFVFSEYGKEIKFNYFTQDLGLTWNFISNFCADMGVHFSQYRNIKLSYEVIINDSNERSLKVGNIEKERQIGLTLGVSYTLNNINMRLATHQSFNNSKNNDWAGVKLSPPTSVSLSVGYRFHLFDKINLRKGQGCPTF